MRVSSTMMVNGYLKQLNTSYENQTKLMEQSDGSKLHRPSDNAVGYSRYLRYQNSMTENVQYTYNVKTAISWMKNTDSALISVSECMATIVEKSNNAANETNNGSDMKAIAGEMLAMVQQLVSDANVQVDGHYLLAGQRDLVQPYTLSADKLECGIAKTLDNNQKAFFSGAAAEEEKVSEAGDLAQMLALKGNDGNTYYLNTKNGKIFTEDFVEEGYKKKIVAGQSGVIAGDECGQISGGDLTDCQDDKFVAKYFRNTSEINDAGRGWSATIDVDGSHVELKFQTQEQYVATYNGDDRYISIVKQNGPTQPSADSCNLTGIDCFGANIFDNTSSGNSTSGAAAINDLLAIVAKTDSGEHRWMSSDGITLANNSFNTIINVQSRLAARQQVYTEVEKMLSTQNTTITGDISSVADTDVAKLAVDLMEAQLIYNMSLSVGGRILPPSLVDYLR